MSGLQGADTDGTPSADEVRFKADELGARFVEQAEATKATFRQLGDIIISDPLKLQVVGSNANCVPGARGGCPIDYQAATGGVKAETAAAFYRGVERTAYTELLPLGYRVTFVGHYPSYFDGERRTDGTAPLAPEYYDCGGVRPFKPWPAKAVDWLLQVRSLDDPRDNLWQPVMLTTDPGHSGVGTPPPAGMLNRMFGAVSGAIDPEKGGLGMSLDELSYELEALGMARRKRAGRR